MCRALCTVYDALLREEGRVSGLPLVESQLTAFEELGCYRGLGRLVAICKTLPSWDHREKGGQHLILEVYCFHISLYVCEPLVPL